MIYLKSVLSVIFLTLPFFSTGQTLQNSQFLGGSGIDQGHDIIQTLDGGYLVIGVTDSSNGSKDMSIIRTDEFGLPIWSRAYGSIQNDEGNAIIETNDGNFVITGSVTDTINGEIDLWIVKIDPFGDTLWTKRYGESSVDIGFDLKETSDSGLIIAGYTKGGPVAGIANVYVVKTNGTGDTLWTRTYGGSNISFGRSIEETSDGGYIIAGTMSIPGGVLLLKINSVGDSVWAKTYGGESLSVFGNGYDVQIVNGSQYIIAGSIYLNGNRDVYLVKTNSIGDTLWTKVFGGNGNDEARSVQQTADGGFIIGGVSNSFGAGDDDAYLIKTDSVGTVLWSETYSNFFTGFDDSAEEVILSSAGSTSVIGTSDEGGGDTQIWFMEVDLLTGIPSVDEPRSLLTIYPNPFANYTTLKIGNDLMDQYTDLRFELMDGTGKKVREILIANSNEIQLYKAEMASGLYFYRLSSEAQTIDSGKLIIQ